MACGAEVAAERVLESHMILLTGRKLDRGLGTHRIKSQKTLYFKLKPPLDGKRNICAKHCLLIYRAKSTILINVSKISGLFLPRNTIVTCGVDHTGALCRYHPMNIPHLFAPQKHLQCIIDHPLPILSIFYPWKSELEGK